MPFKIPVLMYHSVSNDFDRLSISINNFEKHVRILKLMKFNIISFDDDFKKYKKPLIITFDDGYEDNFINALPILLKNNIVATCFLVSDLLGGHNVWDENKIFFKKKKLMNHNQIGHWLSHGMKIGSHSSSHLNLVDIDINKASQEIINSKKKLESYFGTSIKVFSYPYGSYNDEISKIVLNNYQMAVTTKRSRYILGKHRENLIPRVHVNNNTNLFKFFLKINSIYEDLLYKN